MMNVVNYGSQFQIYGEEVKTYQQLPVGSYEVNFNKMTGFYLNSRPDLITNEEKIYGNHKSRVDKILTSFDLSHRNFGVILSGQKGIGKSLLARLLATEAIKKGFPVLVVSGYVPGIASFISSIEQEILVIFDEFEKTFARIKDEADPQEEMLSLFDGIDGGKKLFVITCNEVGKLNEFMLNRPGRFHYHFNISNPEDTEIVEYMKDKLDPKYWDSIQRVVNFSHTVNITYDYLRAIAFDLNQGYTIEECMRDLNITKADAVRFDINVEFNTGIVLTAYSVYVDLYETHDSGFWVYGPKNKRYHLRFKGKDVGIENGQLIVPVDKVELTMDEEDLWEMSDEQAEKVKEDFKKIQPIKITLTKCSYGKVSRFAV